MNFKFKHKCYEPIRNCTNLVSIGARICTIEEVY